MTKHHQLAYPLLIRFCTRHDPKTHALTWSTAVAISAEELPNLETDLGACCMLQRRPRYQVDGVERPDVDPTIPEDLLEGGWYWNGERLTQDGPHGSISIGPRADLDAIWDAARKLDVAYAQLRAGLANQTAQTQPPQPPQPPQRVPDARAVVVVVDRPQTVQLALW
jgi:hypothetical protein